METNLKHHFKSWTRLRTVKKHLFYYGNELQISNILEAIKKNIGGYPNFISSLLPISFAIAEYFPHRCFQLSKEELENIISNLMRKLRRKFSTKPISPSINTARFRVCTNIFTKTNKLQVYLQINTKYKYNSTRGLNESHTGREFLPRVWFNTISVLQYNSFRLASLFLLRLF